MMRELRVEDALLYLDQVKVEFGDRPHIYNEFLDIMKTFKTQQIDTPGVIRRVSNLFQGNKKLVLGFNTFLPEGYKIELPLDGDGPPVAVFRAPGETITHILSGPGAPVEPPTYEITKTDYGRAGASGPASAPGLAPSPPKTGTPSQQQAAAAARAGLAPHAQPQLPQSQQPLRGSGLAHSQHGAHPGPPQRGPAALGKKPSPGMDQAAAAGGGAPSSYQPHPQGVHSQPAAFGHHARGAPAGQAQRQMLAAENAARARLEQQVRGPGAGIPGRLPHQPPPGARGPGMPPGTAQLSPDGKTPAAPRLGAGAPNQLHAAAAPPRPQPGPPQQNAQLLQQQQAPQPQPAAAAAAAEGGDDPQLPPLEFDHAINYVTTIKKRFSDEPETYKKFLEILHTYQKEQRGIKEVLEEVSTLFADHPDLLKEFTYFLPDGVQGQAKAQLEQVAKEAEARKRAASSKQAIMQQAQGMQRQAQQQVTPTLQQRTPPPPPPAPVSAPVPVQAPPPRDIPPPTLHHAPPAPPIPFGATQGRSRERERELYRTAVYGVVSFLPVRPPRKKALTVAQAAAKNGRPNMLPSLPRQPSTAETAFFERAKRHLNRKELAPDKPTGQRRHTPYTEFLKCLHLFGAGVLNKDELVLLLRGLFMQGHAPKSGVNAGGGASNPTIANDAQELLREFEEVLVGRGPYADQETNFKDKSKYGSSRSRDFDFRDCERPTPSYVTYPSDYPTSLFVSNAGQGEDDAAVLNNTLICVGNETMRLSGSPEDYDAVRLRRNVYEEAMFRIEDERFEVDMAIERNAVTMRQVEPYAEEVTALRENEEKDGQPIGRLQYQLKSRALNSIHINAIGRVYGEHGDEIVEHLAQNPLSVLPIVYRRLRQKDADWRKQKSELTEKWRTGCEANYEGSMDYLCYFNRRELERTFAPDQLREECRRASSFYKHPEKQTGSAVHFKLSCSDRSALLYQPHISVQLKPGSMCNQHAIKLLSQQIAKVAKQGADREKVGRIWAEFVVPFFNFPARWVVDEARESFRGELNNVVVKYVTGQRVRTAFGDGTILSYMDGNSQVASRYRIKLASGMAFVQPSAVIHGLPLADGAKYVRRDGQMEKEETVEEKDHDAPRLETKYQQLFGSDDIYIFVRLFSYLVSLLNEIEEDLQNNASMVDPTSKYYNPIESGEESSKSKPRLNFHSVILNLEKLIARKLDAKEFEAFCRRVSKERVHQMAALPKLIEKCADAMLQAAKEDLLLYLYDYCQHPRQDPVQLRAQCVATAPDACYRMQYNTENGDLCFSYLQDGEELLTAPLDDDATEDEDMSGAGEEGEDSHVEDDEDERMDVEDEDEEIRQPKRIKISNR